MPAHKLLSVAAMVGAIALVAGKGGGFGTVVCPCFCSLRDDTRFAGYWVNNFGANSDLRDTEVRNVTWVIESESPNITASSANHGLSVNDWISFDVEYSRANWKPTKDENGLYGNRPSPVGTKWDLLYDSGTGLTTPNPMFKVLAVDGVTVSLHRSWNGTASDSREGALGAGWNSNKVTVPDVGARRGPVCGTECYDPTEPEVKEWVKKMMPSCAAVVTYPFCGRRFNETSPDTGNVTSGRLVGEAAQAHAQFLDTHVHSCFTDGADKKPSCDCSGCEDEQECNDGGFDADGENPEATCPKVCSFTDELFGNYFAKNYPDDEEKTCRQTIKNGACYVAFPKCNMGTTQAYPVCKSHCENELQQCRTMGSGFGHISQIEQECSSAPWADAVGSKEGGADPNVHCTSSRAAGRSGTSAAGGGLLALVIAASLRL